MGLMCNLGGHIVWTFAVETELLLTGAGCTDTE